MRRVDNSIMIGLLLAMTVFVATHLLMSHPLRGAMLNKLGDGGFLLIYSLVSFASFSWMLHARNAVTDDPTLWVGSSGIWHLATILMWFASILLAGSLFKNPAFPDPTAGDRAVGQPEGVFAITRHPMLWSFIIWSLTHSALWGTVANLIVAGGILLLSVVGMIGQDAKKLRLQGPRWREWMTATALIPFTGQLSGRISWRAVWPGWRALLLGTFFWLVASWVHQPLGGPTAGIWLWW
jgi:uncharacterized membrane protein